MLKLKLSILILVLLVSFNSLALYRDTSKIKIDYCEYALSSLDVNLWYFENNNIGINESDVFKQWDPNNEEGIFLISNNTDKTFQTSSRFAYNVTRFTNQLRVRLDDGTTTDVPIFNIKVPKKFIYVRCFFIVNDNYDVLLAMGGNTLRVYATEDFGLAQDLKSYNLTLIKNITGPSEGPMRNSPRVKIWTNPYQSDYVYSFDEFSTTTFNNLKEPGFKLPNAKKYFYKSTRPYAIYKTRNLSDLPSSYIALSLNWAIREPPNNNLVHCPLNFADNLGGITNSTPLAYINTSSSDFSFIFRANVNPLKTIKIRNNNPQDVLYGSDSSFKINRSDEYNVTLFFVNPYEKEITMDIRSLLLTSPIHSQRNMPFLWNSQSSTFNQITFKPFEEKNLTFSYRITSDPLKLIPGYFLYVYWNNNKDLLRQSSTHYVMIGSDEFPYLLADVLSANSEVSGEIVDDYFVPFINIKQRFISSQKNMVYNLDVKPNDYKVCLEIYNSSIYIDQNKLYERCETQNTEVKKGTFSHDGTSMLEPQTYIDYSFRVPILRSWTGPERVDFFIRTYTLLDNSSYNPNFYGKIISQYAGVPKISSGDILYRYNTDLKFTNQSRIDIAKIELFNPSRYENKFNVSISGKIPENFTFSFDGENFNQKEKEFHLFPFQSVTIRIWVKANHSIWPTSPYQDYLNVTAISKDFRNDNGVNRKENTTTFNLLVIPDNFDWFNVFPRDFIIPTQNNPRRAIFLDSENSVSTNKIRFYFFEEGSAQKLQSEKDKSYLVKVSLLNSTSEPKEVFFERVQPQKVNGTRSVKYVEFSYPFTYRKDHYFLRIEIDKDNQLTETTSIGTSGEADNNLTFILPTIITGCEYNSTNYMLTRKDNYWSEPYRDKDNICKCPIERIPIFFQGFCLDPNTNGCASINNKDKCNDWNYTRLNTQDGGVCFWNASNVCLNCNSIMPTCGDYNDEDSCNKDPCQKARLYDCGFLECNDFLKTNCYWNSSESKCMLNISLRKDLSSIQCAYEIDIPSRCSNITPKISIYYKSLTQGCDNKVREFLCGIRTTTIPFFGITEFFASVIILFVLYIIKIKKIKTNPINSS